MKRLNVSAVVVALVEMFAGSVAYSGPLDPPAGPVAPTPGPEPRIAINATNTPGDADSLFLITQAGSYYLTGDIAGVVNKHGIEVASSYVTIDLNGFELAGVPGSLDGVFFNGAGRGLKVTNGSVRAWGGDGVDGGLSGAALVRDVTSTDNVGIGISIGSGGLVEACFGRTNAMAGIRTGGSSIVRNCTAMFNGGEGIKVGNSCLVQGNVATSNSSHGIMVEDASMVVGNSSSYNVSPAAGIWVNGDGNLIDGNHFHGNQSAVVCAGEKSVVIRNAWTGSISGTVNNHFGTFVSPMPISGTFPGWFESSNAWGNVVYSLPTP